MDRERDSETDTDWFVIAWREEKHKTAAQKCTVEDRYRRWVLVFASAKGLFVQRLSRKQEADFELAFLF